MKNLLKIFALVAVMAVASCQEEVPTTAVQGDYTFENNALSINDRVVEDITVLPGAAVSVSSIDEVKADFTLKNIVLGYPELVIPCEVVKLDTRGEAQYAFSGMATKTGDRKISVTGNIQGTKVVMSVVDKNLSPLVKKWMVAAAQIPNPFAPQFMMTVPDVYIRFDNPDITTITVPGLFDEPYPIKDLLSLVNTFILPNTVAEMPLEYFDFTADNYLAFGDKAVKNPSEGPKPSDFSHIIQYYEDTEKGHLNLYAAKNLIDMANKMLEAMKFEPLPSPMVFPLAYSCDGKKLNINLNQDVFRPYLEKIKDVVAGMTYEQALPILGEDFTKESFDMMKPMVVGALEALLDSKTTYEVGMGLEPYAEGPRPWETYSVKSQNWEQFLKQNLGLK